LPTPPLPEAIAIILRTFFIGDKGGFTACAIILLVIANSIFASGMIAAVAAIKVILISDKLFFRGIPNSILIRTDFFFISQC
jgi:hypothetical protein